MKRTVRLVTSIAAIVLTVAIMCVGIFAATKITLNSSDLTLTFKATDVAATVTGTKKMSTDANADDITMPNGGKFKVTDSQGSTHTGTITLAPITFEKLDSCYVITFTVKNDFTAAENVSIDAKLTVTNGDTKDYIVDATTSKLGEAVEAAYTSATAVSIGAGQSLTFTTTISITTDATKQEEILKSGFSSIPFSFTLELTRTGAGA